MLPITEKSIGLDGKVFIDRRLSMRRRSLKGAKVAYDSDRGVLECTVRNQSATGARLSFDDASAVPRQFELVVTGEDAFRRATVRWRSQTTLGVSFD